MTEEKNAVDGLRWANEEIARLREQLDEQCRVNGLGSEREARLMAIVAEKEKALCAAREALIYISDPTIWPSVSEGRMLDALMHRAEKALSSSPRCGHKEEIEDLKKRLKEAWDHHGRMMGLPGQDPTKKCEGLTDEMIQESITHGQGGQDPAKEGR